MMSCSGADVLRSRPIERPSYDGTHCSFSISRRFQIRSQLIPHRKAGGVATEYLSVDKARETRKKEKRETLYV